MEKKIDCICCNGTGKISAPSRKTKELDIKAMMAKKLLAEGYSFRKAAEVLGYKSPRSIQTLIKK